MKWVLRLALVGLVSLAESRSINYEYEDKQGLDSEQKGYAGAVTGKYETMDHNGNVVEVKYIADHMGFRLMDELEVTDKNINSPNAELEIEPTEHKTQTEDQTTNEPIDSSAKLAEQKMEPTTQTRKEVEEKEGEEAAQEKRETGKQLEGEENKAKGKEAGVEAEGEEAAQENIGTGKQLEGEENKAEGEELGAKTEGGEVRNIEAETGEAEGVEAEAGEAKGEEAEGEETEGEESEGEEAEAEEAEDEEAEGEEAEEEEAEGEEEEGEEEEGEEVEDEEAEDEEAEGEEAEAEETEAEKDMTTGEDTEPIESKIESEAETIPTEEEEEELAIDGESKNEEELGNNDINISKRKGEDLEYYQLTEILQVPTAEFEPISILPQNRIEVEQKTAGRSSKAKSLLSVQNIVNTPVNDGRYKQLTEILQIPTTDYIRIPQPIQSADVSNMRISEVNQEMNVLPKRMISITSKQLNNINPGTIMIEKSSISESQSNPEVVFVHMKEPGRLTIEAHPVKKEIAVEPFSRRSSMNIETEKIDEKDFKISEEPKLFVREIFPSEESVQSQLLEYQPEIETIEAEPLVTITSKQLNNINPGTVMIERASISKSQSSPEVVLVRMEEPGKLTIESQPVKKEIAAESFIKRTSMEIEPFRQLLVAQNGIETIESEPLIILPNLRKPSKINSRLLPITIEKSLAGNLPKFTDDQEMIIETEVIEDIPLPMSLIQPAVSKTHVLKKTSYRNTPKQFLRYAPKPIPVLLRETPSSIHLFEEAPTTIEMISQQPTPKEVRIIEVRSAPKPMTILQVNPNGHLNIFEDEQVIYDNKNTKITREVIAEDVSSSEIQSFKVRDFVRF